MFGISRIFLGLIQDFRDFSRICAALSTLNTKERSGLSMVCSGFSVISTSTWVSYIFLGFVFFWKAETSPVPTSELVSVNPDPRTGIS